MRILALLFATSLLTGCVRTETTPVAYFLTADASEDQSASAHRCADACRVASSGSESGFFECLGTCPAVVVQEGAACDAGMPPPNLCYTAWIKTKVLDERASDLFVDIIAGLVDVGVRATALAASGHHEHHEHEHREREHHDGTARERRTSSVGPGRVAASPRRGH